MSNSCVRGITEHRQHSVCPFRILKSLNHRWDLGIYIISSSIEGRRKSRADETPPDGTNDDTVGGTATADDDDGAVPAAAPDGDVSFPVVNGDGDSGTDPPGNRGLKCFLDDFAAATNLLKLSLVTTRWSFRQSPNRKHNEVALYAGGR